MRSLKTILSLAMAGAMFGLGGASSAIAGDFFVFGQWHQQRGTRVGIPVATGGNIGAAASAMASTTSGGALKLQTDAFQRVAFPFTIPIPQRTTIQQLQTSFNFNAPQAANRTMAPGAGPGNVSACPGNLSGCATVAGGTENGRVKYTAGAAQFGGVMNMLIAGTGTLSKVVTGAVGTFSGGCPNQAGGICPIVAHSQIGGGGPAAAGGPIGYFDRNNLPGGPKAQVTATGACPLFGTGCILGSTAVTGTGSGTGSDNYGFPWSTGMLTASATLGTATPDSTFIQTGSDGRTSMGSGPITLVAGMLTARDVGTSYASIDTVTMLLAGTGGIGNAPALAPVGIAAFTALMALAGGYGLSRRNRRDS